VTASDDKTARVVWQDKNGAWREDIIKHNAAVKSVTFSPDSKMIVTTSSDNTAKIIALINLETLDQALLTALLKWAKNQNTPKTIILEGWAGEAFDTFDAADQDNLRNTY
jgi:WD40 repeat protein